jgi:hypothetical protein
MPKKDISDELLEQAGKAMLVQKHQGQAVQNQLSIIQSAISSLSEINMDNLDDIDLLIQKAEFLCEQNGIDTSNYENHIEEIVTLTEEEKSQIYVENLELINIIGDSDNISWQDYLIRIEKYAEVYKIDFAKDPFEDLMAESHFI